MRLLLQIDGATIADFTGQPRNAQAAARRKVRASTDFVDGIVAFRKKRAPTYE